MSESVEDDVRKSAAEQLSVMLHGNYILFGIENIIYTLHKMIVCMLSRTVCSTSVMANYWSSDIIRKTYGVRKPISENESKFTSLPAEVPPLPPQNETASMVPNLKPPLHKMKLPIGCPIQNPPPSPK